MAYLLNGEMMADAPIRFVVDPDKKFQAAINEAIKQVDDLTIPFNLITQSWFKTNMAIFALKGPGKYQDLSEGYKKWKQWFLKSTTPYPILKLTGALEASITQPGADGSIAQIINKTTLVLGSSIPYAKDHQTGNRRKNLPARPWLFSGGEQSSPDFATRRRDIWIGLVKKHVADVTRLKIGSN